VSVEASVSVSICFGFILLLLVGRLDVQSGLLGNSCCTLQFWSGPI
jgi:hypothetical protein